MNLKWYIGVREVDNEMLEDQVAYLLQRYLGNYVRGLSKEALKISVWQGQFFSSIIYGITCLHWFVFYFLSVMVNEGREGRSV